MSEEQNAKKEFLKSVDNKAKLVSKQNEKEELVMGYHVVDKTKLSYNGIFYPQAMKIMYRGADTPEIRHWSTMDANNEFDVMDHFNEVLKRCLKITGGSWKDILEVDRFKLVLMIQEISFDEQENPVDLAYTCLDCDTKNKHRLTQYDIEPNDIDEKYIRKYFDEDTLSLQIRTKDFGSILYRPSTIGAADSVFQFIKNQKPAYVKKHNTILMSLPKYIVSFRNVTRVSDIDNMITEWYAWPKEKIELMDDINNKIDFSAKDSITCSCSNCSTENTVKINPEGRIKSLFLRKSVLDEQLED